MKVTVKIGPRFWDALVLATGTVVAVAETHAIRSGNPESPWSHWWRCRMRLDTKPGRVGLYVGWGLFTAWFLPHLTKPTPSGTATLTLET